MFGNAETVRRYGNQAPEKRFRQQAAAAGPVLPIQNLQTGRAQVSPARVAFCHTIPRRRKSKKAVPVGCVFNHPARFRASVSKVQQKFKLSEQLSPDINKPLTMSSREIAELTDKKHLHVLRDIRKIFNDLGGLPIFGETSVKDIWNRDQSEYLLSKREVLLLVSGYSVKLRARIIDRWIELEEASASACGGVPALLAGQPEHLLADTGGLNRAPAGKKAFDESANIRDKNNTGIFKSGCRTRQTSGFFVSAIRPKPKKLTGWRGTNTRPARGIMPGVTFETPVDARLPVSGSHL